MRETLNGARALALWISRRLLTVLLRVYPAAFRDRCGTAMIDLYCEHFREAIAQRGLMGAAGLFARTGVNFLATGIAERVAAHHSRTHSERAVSQDPTRPGGKGRIWGNLNLVASNVGADVRSATRSIKRAFGLSVAAIACVALGTAASSSVLTLYSAALLRPLPFSEAGRLVRIWLDDPAVGPRRQLNLPDVVDLQSQLTTLEPFVATARSRVMFLGEAGARRVEGEAVTAGYFDLLDIEPFLGRAFSPEEYLAGSNPVMLLSFGTWNSRYGGDPHIVGSTIRAATRNYTVVGVMPPDFIGTIEYDFPDIEFWIPMVHDRTDSERQSRAGSGYIWTIGRLGPGITIEQAEQEVAAIGKRIAQANPETRGPTGMRVERLGESWREQLRGDNYLLLSAAGLLLLIAASNAMGLLTIRSLTRQREMGMRRALGASRARLFRQILAETSMLVVAGTAVGTLLAPSILRLFMSVAPDEVPQYVSLTLDARALLLVLAVLAFTALLAGTMPAALGSRADPVGALGVRGTTAGRWERRLGDRLVVAEIALTTVLVASAGLLLRSYQALGQTDMGFRTEHLLRMAIFVDARDADGTDDLNTLYSRLRNAILSQPGVQGVGLVSPTVPPSIGGDDRIKFDGMPAELRQHGLPVQVHLVGPNFLPTMEIPIVAGRNIGSGDDLTGASVAVVSESLADLMGGRERVLGQVLETEARSYTIVGVTRDVLYFGAVQRRSRDLDVYAPLAQAPNRLVSMAVTTTDDPSRYVGPLRERLARLAPYSPLDWVDPVTTVVDSHLRSPRFYLLILAAFAASALLLAALGLFAAQANLVTRQTAEFGIRSALGATHVRLTGTVMHRGLTIAGLGLCLGGAVALVVGYFLSRTLYGVGSFDAATFIATAAVIGCTAILASYSPARRAARVSPLQAIKAE